MRSPAMERVLIVARRAARSHLPVLIEGEPGVGKETLARTIHSAAAKMYRPFTVLDCASLPAGRLEEMLAAVANSLPRGAEGRQRDGLSAGGGTLFLPHIASLGSDAQALLLRVLSGLGSDGAARRNIPGRGLRVIAATERRLVDFVVRESFRRDVYERLNVLPIWIPPLRDRRSDIAELAQTFLAGFSMDGRAPIEIAPRAMDLLVAHHWPGNLGQLKSVILAAASIAGKEIGVDEITHLLADTGRATAIAGAAETPLQQAVADGRQTLGEAAPLPDGQPDSPRLARYGVARLLDERGELRRFEALEAEVIRFAVDHYRGHMSEVARRLGIGRSTLYRKLRDYRIATGEVGAS